jgi:hypothetical protein
MTTPPSPPPAPLAASATPSRPAAHEQQALNRLLSILFVVFLLPGFIVLVLGMFASVGTSIAHATPPDPFLYLSPLVRMGWGLLALGVVLYVLLARILGRLNPRLRAQAQAFTLQRFRHPRLAVIASLWMFLVLAAMFAAPALVPREVLVGWLTLVAPTEHAKLYSAEIFAGALVASLVIAVAPTLALRLFDRPR